jgi:hypothetical protein
MPADTAVLGKLRALIIHDGTPESERGAALDRLERLLRGHDGPSSITTRITRSTRIGRQRRVQSVDERDRLRGFVDSLSIGDCISRIVRACGEHGPLPAQIDFGSYGAERPVIAVRFPIEIAPQAVDFAAAVSDVIPGTRINLANRSGPEERLFLLYLPGRTAGLDAEA